MTIWSQREEICCANEIYFQTPVPAAGSSARLLYCYSECSDEVRRSLPGQRVGRVSSGPRSRGALRDGRVRSDRRQTEDSARLGPGLLPPRPPLRFPGRRERPPRDLRVPGALPPDPPLRHLCRRAWAVEDTLPHCVPTRPAPCPQPRPHPRCLASNSARPQQAGGFVLLFCCGFHSSIKQCPHGIHNECLGVSNDLVFPLRLPACSRSAL